MRALCWTGLPQDTQLVEQQVPQPRPGEGEVLVQVHAAGVTPSEVIWYPTTHTNAGEPRARAVPAHEFSGVIAELGNGVTGLAQGEAVYGMNDWFADGALAEYCITQPSMIAPKPATLSHGEAASVPISALTAWQGLHQRAKLKAGEHVLIQGGAGAVGMFAVQLARHAGARVTATASGRNLDFVRELGAGQVIDYHAGAFEDAVRDVDVVFDTVGGETLQRSWSVLGPRGRMVTIAASAEPDTDERVKQAFFIVESDRSQLIEIGRMLDSGQLRSALDSVVPFSDAPAAYSEPRRGRGKVVVAVA